MKEKKYILTNETINFRGHVLHRIQAIKDIGKQLVKKGDLGGWVESERNLLHEGDCWIFDDAKVFESAEVALNAQVHNNACIYGKAVIAGGYIYDNVEIYDCAKIGGILDYVLISGNAKIHDNARIFHRAEVRDNAEVYENAIIKNCARIFDKAKVRGDAVVSGNADITKNAEIIRNNDYSVYRDTWSNTCWYNSYITWTRSNGKWTIGTFYGSDKELIREAYKDSKKSGKRYEAIVDVNKLLSTN
jgi:NDP-sugar pyrophosphorylase family protein